jgi:hypothetical protein
MKAGVVPPVRWMGTRCKSFAYRDEVRLEPRKASKVEALLAP